MDIKEIMDAMCDEHKRQCMAQVVYDMAERVRHMDSATYKKAFLAVHEAIWGRHFNEALARKAVANMKNADGTAGESFPKESTDAMLATYKNKFNEWDWYYVVNMMASDYCQIFRTDKAAYGKLACAYLDDVDAEDGRAFLRYVWENEV